MRAGRARSGPNAQGISAAGYFLWPLLMLSVSMAVSVMDGYLQSADVRGWWPYWVALEIFASVIFSALFLGISMAFAPGRKVVIVVSTFFACMKLLVVMFYYRGYSFFMPAEEAAVLENWVTSVYFLPTLLGGFLVVYSGGLYVDTMVFKKLRK